jgi:hypothetical protein
MRQSPFVCRYRSRHWPEYTRALSNRGRLTVWFDEHAVTAGRNTEPAAGPSAPRRSADLAITCALVFKVEYLDKTAASSIFTQAKSAWFMGTNIPGKPRAILLTLIHAPTYRAKCAEAGANGYAGFILQ